MLVIPIQRAYGWRVSFFVFGFLGVIWAHRWYWWYRDNPTEKPGVTKEELEEIGPRPAGAHMASVGNCAAKRNLWTIMLMYFTYCYGSFFFLSWMPTYLVKGRGFSDTDLLLSTLPFILGAIANLAGGFASDAMVRSSVSRGAAESWP